MNSFSVEIFVQCTPHHHPAPVIAPVNSAHKHTTHATRLLQVYDRLLCSHVRSYFETEKVYCINNEKESIFLRDIDYSCIFIEFSFPFKANLKNEKKYQIYGPQPTVTVLLIADLTVTVLWV